MRPLAMASGESIYGAHGYSCSELVWVVNLLKYPPTAVEAESEIPTALGFVSGVVMMAMA